MLEAGQPSKVLTLRLPHPSRVLCGRVGFDQERNTHLSGWPQAFDFAGTTTKIGYPVLRAHCEEPALSLPKGRVRCCGWTTSDSPTLFLPCLLLVLLSPLFCYNVATLLH